MMQRIQMKLTMQQILILNNSDNTGLQYIILWNPAWNNLLALCFIKCLEKPTHNHFLSLGRWLSKVLALGTWKPELDPQDPCKSQVCSYHPSAGEVDRGGFLRLSSQHCQMDLSSRFFTTFPALFYVCHLFLYGCLYSIFMPLNSKFKTEHGGSGLSS